MAEDKQNVPFIIDPEPIMNRSQLARKLRLGVTTNVLRQGLISREEALTILRGPLSPGDDSTIVDDSALLDDPEALQKIDAEYRLDFTLVWNDPKLYPKIMEADMSHKKEGWFWYILAILGLPLMIRDWVKKMWAKIFGTKDIT